MDRRSYAAILALMLLLTARGVSLDVALARTAAIHSPSPRGGISQQSATGQSNASGQSSSTAQPNAASSSSSSQKGSNDPSAESAMHSITVQFDYDFTKTPACTAKVTSMCVQTFNVYDISGDKPYFLFAVPVPPNAQGAMKGITATSPRLLFAVGRHRIGVSAVMPDGQKSAPRECKVIVEIKAPNAPANAPGNDSPKPATSQ
jgi:hypothetical protein